MALARFLNGSTLDILISMQAFVNIAAVVGKLCACRAKTKLIVSEHATISYKAMMEHRGDLKFLVLPHLIRLLYPRANGLVATSPGVLKDLIVSLRVRFDPDKVMAIPNAVDLRRIVHLSTVRIEHPWLDSKTRPVICSVGRLARQKNISLLLHAFAQLRHSRKAYLLILGTGPEREMLGDLAGKLGIGRDVDFIGYVKNPYPFIAGSDVIALTSEEEAFGLVLVEAMACGTPIVSTDAKGGGPRSVLDEGRFGILVSRDDPGAFADSILRIIESKDLRRDLVSAGRRRCHDFAPEVVARQWLSFIERLN
jgi:glycosyltransferase involved in cell wall biosynthesis